MSTLHGGTTLVLLYPRKGLVPPKEMSVWKRGEAPFTARGWEETLARLEKVAHAGD
jgi:hypothetical protein